MFSTELTVQTAHILNLIELIYWVNVCESFLLLVSLFLAWASLKLICITVQTLQILFCITWLILTLLLFCVMALMFMIIFLLVFLWVGYAFFLLALLLSFVPLPNMHVWTVYVWAIVFLFILQLIVVLWWMALFSLFLRTTSRTILESGVTITWIFLKLSSPETSMFPSSHWAVLEKVSARNLFKNIL